VSYGQNRELNRAQAAEGAAPFWVRGIEPHNNSTGHRHDANDLTGLRPIANANALPNREFIECRPLVLI